MSQLRPVLYSAWTRGDFLLGLGLSHQVSLITFCATAAPHAPHHQFSSSSPPVPPHHPSSKQLKHPADNLRTQHSSWPPHTRLSNIQRIPSCLSLHSTEDTAASSSSPTPARKRKSIADGKTFNPTAMAKPMSPPVGVQLEEDALFQDLGPFQHEIFPFPHRQQWWEEPQDQPPATHARGHQAGALEAWSFSKGLQRPGTALHIDCCV